MGQLSWIFLSTPDPDVEYVVVATRGLMISWWNPLAIRSFLQYDKAINRQLSRTEKCVAYSLRVTPCPPEGWTLSVWEDIQSLRRFIKKDPHGEAMEVLAPQTKGHFKYTQWQSKGDNLPTNWEEVARHFD